MMRLFEKVRLHFNVADVLAELIPLSVGLVAHGLAAEYAQQTSQRLSFPSTPDRGQTSIWPVVLRTAIVSGEFGLRLDR
jgi:hypothetical protein